MLKFVFLTHGFYEDHKDLAQLEKKSSRPYVQMTVDEYNINFVVPLRSNIEHFEHVLWTNKNEKCGLDFSKLVVISDEEYIRKDLAPHIRQDEFAKLKGKEYIIKEKIIKHISEYNKAKANLTNPRNVYLCKFSTSQYFEEFVCEISMEDYLRLKAKAKNESEQMISDKSKVQTKPKSFEMENPDKEPENLVLEEETLSTTEM